MKTIKTIKNKTEIPKAIQDAKPGQIVLKDPSGKVLKVVTKTGRGKTDQSYKEITSLKNLVHKAESQGLLRAATKFEGEMDDYPKYDFQEAQFMLAKARTMFEQLPSGARNKFGTPAEFMQFANNPNNAQEMIKMGLAKAIDKTNSNLNLIQQRS